MPNDLLLLEKMLLDASEGNRSSFPYPSINYYNVYISARDYIYTNFGTWVNAAMSEGESFFTDHGPEHVKAVIRTMGKLLKANDSDTINSINPYECFLVLCAALIHDAGNVYSRDAHERRAGAILKHMSGAIFTDNIERSIIAKIARAHGGRVHGSKDTLGQGDLPVEERFLSIHIRPKMLAALLRFADEISEDKSRAISIPGHHLVTRRSALYHAYARAISSTDYDISSRTVSIKYVVEKPTLENEYLDMDESQKYLVDEIFLRLHKMNLERSYCMRYMYEICRVNTIRASLDIVEEDEYDELVMLETSGFEFNDFGYPTEQPISRDTGWSGRSLKEKYFPGVISE